MKTRKRRLIIIALLALPALCLLLLAVSWLSNLAAPSEPQTADRLSELDKARVAEAEHLRSSLGDQVWPGWGAASTPTIVYNDAYAFLVGLSDPADGWITVPRRTREGGRWERVPDDDFSGQPYYRQPLPADGTTPQSYAVLVGDAWASSFMTRDWMLTSLSQQVRDDFSPLFPPLVVCPPGSRRQRRLRGRAATRGFSRLCRIDGHAAPAGGGERST